MTFQKVSKLLGNLLTLHQIGQQAATHRGRGKDYFGPRQLHAPDCFGGIRQRQDAGDIDGHGNEQQEDGKGPGGARRQNRPMPTTTRTIPEMTWATSPRNGRGLVTGEGLTQEQLAQGLGTKRTNLSEMENGRRPIGKNLAKRLAQVLKTDYRVFL